MALQMVQCAGKSLFVQSICSERFFLLLWFGFHAEVRWRSLFSESTCRNRFCMTTRYSRASFCVFFWTDFSSETGEKKKKKVLPCRRVSGLMTLCLCDIVNPPTFLFSTFRHSGPGSDSRLRTVHVLPLSLKPSLSAGGLLGRGGGSISPQIFSLARFLFAWVCVASVRLNLKSRQKRLFDGGVGTLSERCGTRINK